MSFCVQVRLDMQGKRSCTIRDLTLTMKVAELKRRIADKEGLDDLTLVYRTKPLQDNLTLADYNLRMNVTIFASARLRGGEDSFRKWDQEKGKKLGLSATKEHCSLFVSAVHGTCTSDGVSRVKFEGCPEGHVFCADCLFETLKKHIMVMGRKDLPCPMSCNFRPSVDALFVAAALTEDEEKSFGVKLDENFMGDSTCPHQTCGIFVHGADDVNRDRLECPACRHNFCKHCNKKWIVPGLNICGRPDCSTGADLADKLMNCDLVTMSGIQNVPKSRICPSCSSFIEWKSDCKHMTCDYCKHQFCFSCLQKWTVPHRRVACNPAPIQSINA